MHLDTPLGCLALLGDPLPGSSLSVPCAALFPLHPVPLCANFTLSPEKMGIWSMVGAE